jgi:uncharacterized membrane protein
MSSSEIRPILKTKFRKADFVLEAIAILALIAIWVFPIITYNSLPDTIPSHFGLQGKADGWGSKSGIFLLPVINILLFTGLTILSKYPHKFNYPVKVTEENAILLYNKGTRFLRILKVSVVLLFLLIESFICSSSQYKQLPIWFLPLILMVPVVLPIVLAFSFSSGFSPGKTSKRK